VSAYVRGALPGRWVEPPQGALFAPWVFERGPDGRLWYAPGEWRRPDGSPVDAPQPLAIAAVESGAVVTADGSSETTGPTLRRRPKPVSSAP